MYLNLPEAAMGDIDIGLPELLGSQWTTVALILVVVILLLVFLLVRMRNNRKRAALEQAVQAGVSGKSKKGKEPKGPKQRKSNRGREAAELGAAMGGGLAPGASGGFLSQPAAEPPSDMFGERPGGAPSEVLGEAAGEPAGDPVAAAPAPGKAKAAVASPYANLTPGSPPAADPIRSVLDNILQGWGDLTNEDTNRLKLFRADKVVAAIMATELTKDLKNSEHARSRLNQLRRYASSIKEEKQAPGQPLAEFAGIGLGPAQQQAAAAGAAAAGAVTAAAADEESADESGVDLSEDDETAGEERASESSWGVTSGKELWGTAAAAAIWGGGEPEQTDQAEDAATPAAEEKPVEIHWEPEPGEDAEQKPSASPWGNTEETVAAAAAAFWAATDTPEATDAPAVETPPAAEAAEVAETPVVEEMVLDEELPVEEELPVVEEVTGFEELAEAVSSAPQGTIGTADDLLALPTSEQITRLGMLEPDELTKVFRATDDTRLKKSIVETLEQRGLLDTIHQFFDDPDPEVQKHALDAADRLLGTEQ